MCFVVSEKNSKIQNNQFWSFGYVNIIIFYSILQIILTLFLFLKVMMCSKQAQYKFYIVRYDGDGLNTYHRVPYSWLFDIKDQMPYRTYVYFNKWRFHSPRKSVMARRLKDNSVKKVGGNAYQATIFLGCGDINNNVKQRQKRAKIHLKIYFIYLCKYKYI